MRNIFITCLLLMAMYGCAGKKYKLTVEPIETTTEKGYMPVFSEGPMGERYTWEAAVPAGDGYDAFDISLVKDTIKLDFNQALMDPRRRKKSKPGGNYRVIFDVKSKGEYKWMQIWANVYELDSIKKGVYPRVFTEKELREEIQKSLLQRQSK